MEESNTDKDSKIALIMDQSGASAEEAARALQDTGGNVNRAMAQILEDDDEEKKKHMCAAEVKEGFKKGEQGDDLLNVQEPAMPDDISLSAHVLNADNSSQGEPTTAPSDDDDVESGLVAGVNNDEEMLSLPRPPQQEHLPGAFHPDGRNAGEVSVVDEETTMASSEPSPPLGEEDLLSATLVDPEEESRKIQERVDKEVDEKLKQKVAEIEQNTEVAEVVTGFWCTPRARRLIALVTFLAIVAIVLGTVLPSALAPEPKSPLPELMELLSSVSFDGGMALRNASTPQRKAVNWLAGNANLHDFTDEEKIQRYVLATLYESTSGDNWKFNRAWLSDSNECDWYSNYDSFCSNGTVTALGVYHNNLDGTIPVELALFSNALEKLELHVNSLTGPIPSRITQLTSLMKINLYDNGLTGSIPSEIGRLARLTSLNLYKNSFTGQIPSEMGKLTLLRELALNTNGLTGTIPSEIQLLTDLDWLVLYGNDLGGDFTCLSSIHWCKISCNDETNHACRSLSHSPELTTTPMQPSNTPPPPPPSGVWTPLFVIDGDTEGDWFGWSVSMASNGDLLAVGADQRKTSTHAPGYVSIHTLSDGARIQTLFGEAASDRFGASVSFSADGSIIAIGASSDDNNGLESGSVYTLQRSGNSFLQIGDEINGEAERDFSGVEVSLAGNGHVLAIGAIYNDGGGNLSGHVRVYERIGTTWSQVGQDIDGEKEDESGCGVSLSHDGTVLAVGGRYHHGTNGPASGNVRIFRRSGESWELVADIDGEQAYEWSGWKVSLSSDGNTVAIGAPNASGQVRVFRWNGVNYSKLGGNINGIYDRDRFGITVSLSSDGNIVASGNEYAGHIQVFGWSGVSDGWVQIGDDIISGKYLSVSLSGDGKMIAIGAPTVNGTGKVSVYRLV